MNIVIIINRTISELHNVISFHWFPDNGELAIYTKEGTWNSTGVKVSAIHVRDMNAV